MEAASRMVADLTSNWAWQWSDEWSSWHELIPGGRESRG